MKRVTIILAIVLALLVPTSPALAMTQEERMEQEYLGTAAARMSYEETTEFDAWRVFDNSYRFPANKVTRVDYVGTSKHKITTKTLKSFRSSHLKTWHVFTINAKKTISKAEFKATKKVLPACKREDSTRCYWDAKKRGNKKGKSFVSYTRYTISYVK